MEYDQMRERVEIIETLSGLADDVKQATQRFINLSQCAPYGSEYNNLVQLQEKLTAAMGEMIENLKPQS